MILDPSSVRKPFVGQDLEASEENLTSIVCVSRAADPDDWRLQAESISEHTRLGGLKSRITGLMVVQSGFFFQSLEGEKRAVLRLFDKIQQDPRHTDLRLLLMENVASRSFSTWSKVSIRRNEPLEDTARRTSAVVERLTNLVGVTALDIFRALFVPSVTAAPLAQSDKRVWRLAFLSPSGLWSANIIQYFAHQMQQRVGRTWVGEAGADEEGSLVEYVDFDDADLGHVRGISFYNEAVANPALIGIMENVAIVVVLLNSNEIAQGESYIASLLGHPVVERYHPGILLVSSHEARLNELMNSALVNNSGLIFRAAALRVSDSPAIWNETFSFGEELGQVGGVSTSNLAVLTAGVDAVEEDLKSNDLTATSVTSVLAQQRYRDIYEPMLDESPPAPAPPEPKSPK
jgi:hypothetical protein